MIPESREIPGMAEINFLKTNSRMKEKHILIDVYQEVTDKSYKNALSLLDNRKKANFEIMKIPISSELFVV